MACSSTPVVSAAARHDATTGAAFRHVETVRVRTQRAGTRRCFSLTGPRLSNNFRGSMTHPTDLLHPASDLCFRRPTGFATGLVASLCPERNSTSWIASTNFRGGATPAFQGHGFNLTRQRSCYTASCNYRSVTTRSTSQSRILSNAIS